MASHYKFGRMYKREGIWYADYYLDGKRIRESTGETLKRKAEAYLDRRKQEWLLGTAGFSGEHKFADVAADWLDTYSKVYHSQSHYVGNTYRLKNHILPYFGTEYVSDITQKDIYHFLSEMKSKEVMVRRKATHGSDKYVKESTGKPLSAKQINLTLDTLRLILAYAKSNGYAPANPADGLKKLKAQTPAFRYLTGEQTKKLLEYCSPGFYPICATAVYTGMRLNEIVGLKWRSVLYDSKRIIVESSGAGPTKSRKVRSIPLNENLEDILNGYKNESEYVFPDEEGNMKGGKRGRVDFRSPLETALKKAGLPRIKFHDLRHTFASNFVMKGGSIISLKEILGHHDISTTMMYAHLAPSYLEEEINRLDFS